MSELEVKTDEDSSFIDTLEIIQKMTVRSKEKRVKGVTFNIRMCINCDDVDTRQIQKVKIWGGISKHEPRSFVSDSYFLIFNDGKEIFCQVIERKLREHLKLRVIYEKFDGKYKDVRDKNIIVTIE